jgi:hypothetical protein
MLSPNSAASDNVRKEVDLAEGSKRKLFPVLLAAVTLPSQLRYQLAGIQLIDYAKDPEENFKQLVEALQAHQKGLAAREKEVNTREVELVISGLDLARFGPQEQEKLLDYISQVTSTPRASLSLTNLTSGSVHAFIQMPAHSAYILKTAALNQDLKLVHYGIDAIRLDGEQNYVLVKTGGISSLRTKPLSSLLKRFLLGIVAVGIAAGALWSTLPLVVSIFTPTLTPTPTSTSTPRPTRTPTDTPTVVTPTPLLRSKPTPTPTPTSPAGREAKILYDFVEEAPYALWNICGPKTCDTSAGETTLKFNDAKSSADGLAITNSSYLEDGRYYDNFLFTQPKSVQDGRVRGFYDLSKVDIQSGDRFTARIGFIADAKDTAGVTYRLYFSFSDPEAWNFKPDSKYSPTLIAEYAAAYDGKIDDWRVMLSKNLVGQRGWFILEVDAGNSPVHDWAVWVEPRLERP